LLLLLLLEWDSAIPSIDPGESSVAAAATTTAAAAAIAARKHHEPFRPEVLFTSLFPEWE